MAAKPGKNPAASDDDLQDAFTDAPPDSIDDLLDDVDGYEEDGGAGGEPETDDKPRGNRLKKDKSAKPGRLQSILRSPPSRPGEQNLLQSRFLAGLLALIAVLTLASGTVYFMMNRNIVQQRYDLAMSEQEQGNYTLAIKSWNDFLAEFPGNSQYEAAVYNRDRCLVEKEVSSSTPDWAAGLKALESYVQQHRDQPSFDDVQREYVAETARRIAEGALETAQRTRARSLLAVATEAEKLLDRHALAATPPVEIKERLARNYKQAEALVLQQETLNATFEKMDAAINRKDPILAFDARRLLLDRYPELTADKGLAARHAKALEVEQQLIARDDSSSDALTDERATPFATPLTLALHTRALTDEVSAGRTVLAVGQDCLFGVDTITGDLVWRRVIGLDTPFAPVRVDAAVPAALYFDTNHRELVLVQQTDGALIWRQPVGQMASAPPLVESGQIFLPTVDRALHLIDLASGQATARLKFSRSLAASPVLLSDNTHLLVAGEQAVLYVLKARPLECVSVVYSGHPQGSIRAPLLPMGKLVLMAENDRKDSARLRVFDAADPAARLPVVAEERVRGQVLDAPILRGKDLFVSSTYERVAAFTVSDDLSQQVLTPRASIQVDGAQPAAMYLAAGPDGQLWMASTAVRKFQLKGASIQLDDRHTAVGFASQPLQTVGELLFSGRKMPYSDGVTFSQIERGDMVSRWKTVVGARILAAAATSPQSILCLDEEGNLFQVTQTELQNGGFRHRANGQLELPEGMTAPLRARAFEGGRIVADCGGQTPRVWVVSPQGQVEQTIDLDAPLEAAPVIIAERLVLPLPGRLKAVSLRAGLPAVDDFLPGFERGEDRTWRHLINVDAKAAVAADSAGTVLRVEYAEMPVPHLKETARLDLGQPIDVELSQGGGMVFVAPSTGKLHVLDAVSLTPSADVSLPAPCTNRPWYVEGFLFVETEQRNLNCYQVESGRAQPLWSQEIGAPGLAGTPVVAGSGFFAVTRNGNVVALDPASGERHAEASLGQPVTLAPQSLGNFVVVPAVDGSLYRIESVLEGGQ